MDIVYMHIYYNAGENAYFCNDILLFLTQNERLLPIASLFSHYQKLRFLSPKSRYCSPLIFCIQLNTTFSTPWREMHDDDDNEEKKIIVFIKLDVKTPQSVTVDNFDKSKDILISEH